MKPKFGFILAVVAASLLYGCFGKGGGSPAPAPTDVVVTPKDSRVIVTWTMAPGVEYWVWKAAASGVSPDNCSSLPSCGVATKVTSPASISVQNDSLMTLVNGTGYSFSVNGRTNGGPGGLGSSAVDAMPRLAGESWTASAAPTANNLRGVAYGANGTRFVAVGDAGDIFSSVEASNSLSNGSIWTAATTNPAPGTTLYAVNYDVSHGKFLVAGAGGVILQSTDAATWTLLSNTTTPDLYAITSNSSTIVATGAAGTIITSTNSGTSWTTQSISGAPALNSVIYGHATATGVAENRFVAVGASGTVFYSTDGLSWATGTSGLPTSSNIKGVTYGSVAGVGTFLAITDDGKVMTSTDGNTWTAPVTVSSALNAVTASLNAAVPSTTVTTVTNAFVAVDNSGNIFQSTNGGSIWTQVYTGSGSALYAVTRGGLYDYSAVGATGSNLYAD